MQETTPLRIGKFDIVRQIGKGGMGRVYEAVDPQIQRRVAIKTVLPELLGDDAKADFLERFRREAQAAARCDHANIVAVHEYGQHHDVPYIVMEYVDGQRLDQFLKSKRPPLSQSLAIIAHLLRALNAAHRSGIVHRDIKPANVIVDKSGRAKLADFGVAQIDNEAGLTRVGAVVGTPGYMAPEQAARVQADPRSDLFAVARLGLEILQQTRLPKGLPTEILPPLASVPNEHQIDLDRPIPSALAPVFRRGLSFMPDQRFQTARDFFLSIKEAINVLRGQREALRQSGEPGTNSDSGQHSNTLTPVPLEPEFAHGDHSLSGLNGANLEGMREDLERLIQSDAGPLFAEHVEHALSYAEAVMALAESIGKTKDRQRFIDRWLHA